MWLQTRNSVSATCIEAVHVQRKPVEVKNNASFNTNVQATSAASKQFLAANETSMLYYPKADLNICTTSCKEPNRNLSEVYAASESHCLKETGNLESELPQEVLKSLFNMPTPKNAEHEPNTMNWRNVVKKMASLGQRLEPGGSEQEQSLHEWTTWVFLIAMALYDLAAFTRMDH